MNIIILVALIIKGLGNRGSTVLEFDIPSQDTYIQERADAMENIHSTIVELGSIFKQLAEMVKEQEEAVIR